MGSNSTKSIKQSEALLDAIMENDLEAIRTSISRGADIEKRYCKTGVSAIHYVAFKGHHDTLKYFLTIGAKVDSEDNYGRTPLYFAAYSGKEICVKLLIEQKADVNKQTYMALSTESSSSNSFTFPTDIPSNNKPVSIDSM